MMFANNHESRSRQPGPREHRSTLLTLALAATLGMTVPISAQAWSQWRHSDYPTSGQELDAGMDPNKVCQEVYTKTGRLQHLHMPLRNRYGAQITDRSGNPVYIAPGFYAIYQLHEPHHSESLRDGRGRWVDGYWIGDVPQGYFPHQIGSCWIQKSPPRNALQADQDFGDDVVDHRWDPSFVIPRGGGTPIGFPPPFPPPPAFTEAEVQELTDSFSFNGETWIVTRVFRNLGIDDGDKVIEVLQQGWVVETR